MRKLICGLAATAFLSAAAPVYAQSQLELTLDAYVAVLKATGASVQYSDRVAGDDGSVEYHDFHLTAPHDELDLTVDWVRFEPQTLQPEMTLVTFAPEFKAVIKPDDVDEPVNLSLSSDALKILTNAVVVDPDTLEKIDFRMSAESLILATKDTPADAPFKINLGQSGLNFSFLVDHTARRVTGAYSAAQFDTDFGVNADGTNMEGNSTAADIGVEYFFDMPDEEAPETYFSAGKEFSFNLTSGPSEGNGKTDQQGLPIEYKTKTTGSRALIEHIDGALTYNASGDNFDVGLSFGGALPPMNFSLSKILFDLAMPTRPSDAADDVRFGVVLTDFVAGDNVWNMIDAGGAIPRDPALIDIRLAAKLQLLKNVEEVFSPMGPVATGSVPPTEVAKVESLDINALDLSAGGASVSADGGVTFDNSGPFPIPDGEVQVVLTGLQTLSTTLVELGLLDQMQAGMVMGMMMGFARPGEQPDQFVSDISFKDGAILANGQPIGP